MKRVGFDIETDAHRDTPVWTGVWRLRWGAEHPEDVRQARQRLLRYVEGDAGLTVHYYRAQWQALESALLEQVRFERWCLTGFALLLLVCVEALFQ